jgi:hypothetical protein
MRLAGKDETRVDLALFLRVMWSISTLPQTPPLHT